MKIYKRIIITALALLMLSACAKADSNSEGTAVSEQQAEVYVMQKGDTQVSGEVVSIIGNEVTLELGEVTESKKPSGESPEGMDGEGSPEPPSEDSNGGEKGERPDFGGGERGERPDMGSGEMPDFGNGEMPAPGDFDKGENGGQFGGKRGGFGAELKKSGESGTYIIPVGMTVSGLSGRSSDYSGISEGDILTLTIDSEGTVKAAEVR